MNIDTNIDTQSAGPPELEQSQHSHIKAGTGSRSRGHARGSLGSVGLLVARYRAVGPRCARLLLADHGYSQLLDASRIARCHAGKPRYARLLIWFGWEKYIALVSRFRASFARGCSWLLMASHGCSRLPGSRRPGPKSPGRMSASPMPRSALRGHARGRDSLRAAGRYALPGLMCALVYIFERAAQKTADSDTSSRRRRGEVPSPRRSADVVAKRRRRDDGTSTSPR
jgi:hypothetical protein